MKPSKQCADFIKLREKCTLYVIKVGGINTIGWGHTILKSESHMLNKGFRLTQKQADDLFYNDLCKHSPIVDKAIKVPLNQHQYDALVSIAFNFGHIKTQLAKVLNMGFPAKSVAETIIALNSSGFLKKSRKADAHLFLTGQYIDPQKFKA
ncbi:GH24 family phage-related lysozyme (muramidase) [Arcticibacter pallidicorallinus]|uniref:Lysozyme n=1 Tax=Arcticibacter pallidicorallinus TaxID=1259464 RepID=A0A2T0TXM0_9SPHI|nr:lysozyme [Arcticibacter pallidicorallinus]PRY50390.1 GH24 family phage-related lysozyme (muramidase) [Arcticibacter pallidicorallinus]